MMSLSDFISESIVFEASIPTGNADSSPIVAKTKSVTILQNSKADARQLAKIEKLLVANAVEDNGGLEINFPGRTTPKKQKAFETLLALVLNTGLDVTDTEKIKVEANKILGLPKKSGHYRMEATCSLSSGKDLFYFGVNMLDLNLVDPDAGDAQTRHSYTLVFNLK